MVNEENASQYAHEIDRVIVHLQAQGRKLIKQKTYMQKAVKEPRYFDGIILDPTIYLRWVQTLENYFEANGCSHEQSFLISTQIL